MAHRILVPVNFSAASGCAVAVARNFFAGAATIRLLYVIAPSELASATANPTINPMHAREERSKAEALITEKMAKWARGNEETAVEIGNAAEKISVHADEWNADLIVMGTRSRSGLAQFLHGSATEWLVRHARQPVMAVHELELSEAQAGNLPPMEPAQG